METTETVTRTVETDAPSTPSEVVAEEIIETIAEEAAEEAVDEGVQWVEELFRKLDAQILALSEITQAIQRNQSEHLTTLTSLLNSQTESLAVIVAAVAARQEPSTSTPPTLETTEEVPPTVDAETVAEENPVAKTESQRSRRKRL